MVIFVLKRQKWYDKLLNVKYLPLFHHFKAIYQFPKHIILLVEIVANTSLNCVCEIYRWVITGKGKCEDTKGATRGLVYSNKDKKDKTQVLPTYEVFSLKLHNKYNTYTYEKEHEH